MNDVRKDFPILNKKVNGHPLIYFDNAATSQKPYSVINAITEFYTQHNNNIHRSVHEFGEETTQMYEAARTAVARWINADPSEIVFTAGTTDSINRIAQSWAKHQLKSDDEILITQMEHHSNIIPWQQIVSEKGGVLKYVPITAEGILDYQTLPSLLSKKTKLLSVTHVSNALGTRNDITRIIQSAHEVGAKVLIDAAQSAPHERIDVKKLSCDFLAFSGHKMLGPTGIGVLYIKKELHDQIAPYQGGGGMVYEVDLFKSKWQKMPHKLEAGTPAIAQAIGLAAAIEYLQKNVSFEKLRIHEASLCKKLIAGLLAYKKVTILGPIQQLQESGHLVSFTIDGLHPHDIAHFLSKQGICVRAGNHCAQPLAKVMNISGSVRASFYLYNTALEVEQFLHALELLLNTL